jgi:hypothetical protein
VAGWRAVSTVPVPSAVKVAVASWTNPLICDVAVTVTAWPGSQPLIVTPPGSSTSNWSGTVM